jgi:hypothetical protein
VVKLKSLSVTKVLRSTLKTTHTSSNNAIPSTTVQQASTTTNSTATTQDDTKTNQTTGIDAGSNPPTTANFIPTNSLRQY